MYIFRKLAIVDVEGVKTILKVREVWDLCILLNISLYYIHHSFIVQLQL